VNKLPSSVAVLLGAVLVSAAILIGFKANGVGRYQLARTGEGFMRLDTRTGEVVVCSTGSYLDVDTLRYAPTCDSARPLLYSR
jgi:hypothetical protein